MKEALIVQEKKSEGVTDPATGPEYNETQTHSKTWPPRAKT
jgi:hypothetical protein